MAPTLQDIAATLNFKSGAFDIGSLQAKRVALGKTTVRSNHQIFNINKVRSDWAHHHGGRVELQYNIGVEEHSGIEEFRYGIAFSFETSRSITSIDELIPKALRFNEFMSVNTAVYSDMRMWHYKKNVRSSDYMPGIIPSELVQKNVFLFMGKRQPIENINYDEILSDFDRLFPLYDFVEGHGNFPQITKMTNAGLRFRSGCSVKATTAVSTPAQKALDITLRHNELQLNLYRQLVTKFGEENVGTELVSGIGTSVDVVVRQSDGGYWFYEIKTSLSPRACIREAIGQLLEYSFWPGAQEAHRLIVVGEAALDVEGEIYLRLLCHKFGLPISYEQMVW